MKFTLYAALTGLSLLALQSYSIAQDKLPIKFGKVAAADFDLSAHHFDSSAAAVVIADAGSTAFEPNNTGDFLLVFKRNTRIKILNKNGFDASTVEIYLYHNEQAEETVDKIRATTYNLENGQVVATTLDSKSIFKEKLDKKYNVVKFTLPAVREGSIIEYSYVQRSEFKFNLQPWTFQGEYPVLWSEYEVEIPQFYDYVFLTQGYQPYYKHTTDSRTAVVTIRDNSGAGASQSGRLNCQMMINKWIMKDVPALREEAFTSTINNHVSKIEFQWASFRPGDGQITPVMDSWEKLSEKMRANEYFGADLDRNNVWMDDELKPVLEGASTLLERAHRVFAYVRDNFTCTRHSGVFMDDNLRSAFRKKSGSVAEINLLLIAMLRHVGVDANPVILSTTPHGYTHEFYPLINRYNYVIAEAKINGATYYLDASFSSLGFNKLPLQCYNGHARSLTRTGAVPVFFEPDSLMERKVTSVFVFSEEDGRIAGQVTKSMGYYESLDTRSDIKSQGQEAFFKKIASGFAMDVKLLNEAVDSLKNTEAPVKLKYDFETKLDDDVVYLNPMFDEIQKENPFKAANRFYPVEMPHAFDYTYVLNMEIPKGYAVDELPKSARVEFGDKEGSYEYLIVKDETKVQLRSRLRFNKARFIPEDYAELRDFYSYVVKKQAEPIVLKKIK